MFHPIQELPVGYIGLATFNKIRDHRPNKDLTIAKKQTYYKPKSDNFSKNIFTQMTLPSRPVEKFTIEPELTKAANFNSEFFPTS